jgi:hypothetical protein
MNVFIPVAAAAGGGFWILMRQSGNGRRPAIVLSALPLALLFLVAPVPIAALRTVRAAQVVGASERASTTDAARMATGMLRPLWFGSIGLVVAAGHRTTPGVSTVATGTAPAD